MEDNFHLKLMTYNIGGGRKDSGSLFSGILEIIKQAAPDILGVQEATEWSTLDEENFSQPREIVRDGLKKYNYFFGPTLTMSQNFHVKKEIFLHGLFSDWADWQQGNAIFSRWPFVRFGNSSKPGQPKNIPINKTIYSGNRDTDPRYAILAKIDLGFTQVFALVTHLTTLYGERGPKEVPGKNEEAQAVRWEQCERILDLTRAFILEKNEVLIMMGDFNAIPGEPALLSSLETKAGFVRLVPSNNTGTHLKVAEPVDHILIYPGNYHIKYSCKVINNEFVASDHNPVVAEISLHNSNSKAFKAQGAGVFRENS
ncbi:MAG TPA: endonuclease/exonuclease/phosphatase family protein [Anaerolineales bacterium]|nr:endonuclease/exonuclease/phosphatase family protein [Anaerolineales bacterium]